MEVPPFHAALAVLGCGLAILLTIDMRIATTRLHAPARSCASLRPSRLERVYLAAYGFAVAADWLQGPYVYALYQQLGYDRHAIALLFVVGFGTSGVAGPLVGDLADRFGRRQIVLTLYCGCYVLSCVSKHFQVFGVLLCGRLLGGIATSALFSCFESWIVAEHAKRSLPRAALEGLLSRQYFVNGLMGIAMGVTAQKLVDAGPLVPLRPPIFVGGELFAFDASIGCLLLAAIVISSTWDENFAIDLAAEPTVDSKRATNADAWLITDLIGGVAVRMGAFKARREPRQQSTTSSVLPRLDPTTSRPNASCLAIANPERIRSTPFVHSSVRASALRFTSDAGRGSGAGRSHVHLLRD